MDQYQIIDNLMDLFSSDDEVKLEALLAKKEWILDRFYIPFSILPSDEEEHSDLFALKNLALPFHKFMTKDSSKSSFADKFNKKFRRVKLYEYLPNRPKKHIFYVQADFRKLSKDDYKVLVPYFFYCLTPSTLEDLSIPNDVRKVIAIAIEGEESEAMLLIDQKHLNKNILKVDCFNKIYIYDDMKPEEIKAVKDIARYLHLPVVTVHVGSK